MSGRWRTGYEARIKVDVIGVVFVAVTLPEDVAGGVSVHLDPQRVIGEPRSVLQSTPSAHSVYFHPKSLNAGMKVVAWSKSVQVAIKQI